MINIPIILQKLILSLKTAKNFVEFLRSNENMLNTADSIKNIT